MAIIGKLVFLCIAASITAQDSKTNHTQENYDKEKILRLLQTPPFRSDTNSPDYLSYLPYKQEFTESNLDTEQSKSEVPSHLLSGPSTDLKPPKTDAFDSYASFKYPTEGQYKTPTLYQELPKTDLNPYLFAQPIPIKTIPKYIGKNSNAPAYYSRNPYSKQLDLPLSNSQVQHFALPPVPSAELQIPLYEPYIPFNTNYQVPQPNLPSVNVENINIPQQIPQTTYPEISQPFVNYKSESIKPTKQPTNLFPKKYNPNLDDYQSKKVGIKSIPVVELTDDNIQLIKINKVTKPEKLKVYENQKDENVNEESLKDKELEKKLLKFEETQKKNMQKKNNDIKKQQQLIDATIARASVVRSEPVASETGFNHFQNTGDTHDSPSAFYGVSDAHHDAGGERTEFQMHGQHGPHSYKFGYDTGKGKSRQFRYEERDNDGFVKGHYGFYDKHGKLQVVNYDAHPHHGFHAETTFGEA